MGGVCCKEGVIKEEQAARSRPGPAADASAPAQAPDIGALTTSGASELVKESPQEPLSQNTIKGVPQATIIVPAPSPATVAAASSVDPAQITISEDDRSASPGDVVEAVCVKQAVGSAAPAARSAPPLSTATTPSTKPAVPASGLPPVVALQSKVERPSHSQPTGAKEGPHAISQVLTDLVQAVEPSPRHSTATLDISPSGGSGAAIVATAQQLFKPEIDTAALQAHRRTEAGVSVTRNPTASTQQVDDTTNIATATTIITNGDDEELAKVKVATTRRAANQAGGGGSGAAGEGSPSVSHSHSTASSRQPGSSAAGPEQSLMVGSSTAQEPSATGEMMEAKGTAGNMLAGGDTIEGTNNVASDPSGTSSTPASKGAPSSGFMFGAPRVKDHRREKKKEAKRSKSQSSGSNASGAQPAAGGNGGSEGAFGSKASGSKASGSDVPGGGGGIRNAGSSSAGGTMLGSSAADPSIGSSDMMMGASTPTMGPAQGSTGCTPSMGAQLSNTQGGGSSTAGAAMDYSTVGRRITRPTRSKPTEGAAARAASRVRSDNSTSVTNSSSNDTDGAAVAAAAATAPSGCGKQLPPGAGIFPESVPEGEEVEEDVEEEDQSSGGSRRSSSEHLSIMSPPEGSDVENVLMLICNIFQLPVALVAAYRSANIFIRSTALRLTDDDRWRYSLAQWSMLNAFELRDVLMVPNAALDERYREYYCVKNEPKVKFFMASPLRSSTGDLLGTLCMADFNERALEPTNLLVVNNLQTLVIRQLERDMALAQERAENELATQKLQEEMMRALDHFEKCIMFVDTSKPGWEVLYVNLAWEHVTGIPREHVLGRALPDNGGDNNRVPRVHVMGRPLQDFFMALGGAALDWSSTAEEVASRAEFTVHRVAVRQKPDKLVSLHLRLATQEASGELDGLLPKGLPGWVKARGNEAHNYFVFVEEISQQGGGGSTVYEALAKHVEKVPGLELSHLLGKGGFGSVYYGTWNGMPVAVKMIDNKLTKTNTEGVSLEALMGQELSHPNIVKTIKYVMRNAMAASSISGSNSRGGPSSARNMPPGMHSRNREGAGPYSGGVITSRHGSRNIVLPTVGSSGPGSNTNGNGFAPRGTEMIPYMTSAQPGLSGMTSAQMAAAADLTSASAMQHLSRMGTTMTSDATTVAGGGSQYSGQPYNGPSAGSGVPPREANLVAAAAVAAAEAAATGAKPSNAKPGTATTSATTTSGATAVGPASIQASSTSTAAGPPSIASASGVPANLTGASPLNSSRAASVSDHANTLLATGSCHNAAARMRASGSLPPAAAAGGGGGGDQQHKPPSPAKAAQPPPAAAAAAVGGAPSTAATFPPGAPAPDLQNLTSEEQQQAAVSSRGSQAFSTITSGGEMLVPGKGRSRSTSTSSGCHTQQVGHPGSVGSGEDMGEVWIIMEFCDRGSLQDALDRGALKLRKPGGELGETHLPMLVATACEVASALHYLHERGIVHGDLTAWNVMLCTSPAGQQDRIGRNFVAKVADFGLSRTLDVKSKIKTRTYGTISHMPPECLISGIISKATDVFAFGVLLWQMYTGLRPWAGMNHGQIIYNVGMKNVQLLFPPGTPPAIADLSSSCTRTEPTHRPSFQEILNKLDNIRASLGL